ncbi:MAG: DUF1080 domain-containing protein [Saprospiraceae bacterium]|nr:DUF1080 domain-containing protein [Lewinella sp.]
MKTCITTPDALNSGKRLFPLLLILLISCSETPSIQRQNDWQSLFNEENLEGWDTYLNRPDLTQPESDSNKPFGLNNDPLGVFSVVTEDGLPAIRVSGQTFGGISTVDEFENYHFQVQFKWGDTKWPPRQNAKMDSGVLYHAVEPHGADGGSWMRSQEFQVQQGDCGDYWGVAGAVFDIPARMTSDSTYVYDPNGNLYTFKANTKVGRHCIKNPDAEKPTGSWNTIDLYCSGDTAVHMINGVVNMILYRSQQMDGGQERPLTSGKIQIQSEGAEIFYRDFKIRPIKALPVELLNVNDKP